MSKNTYDALYLKTRGAINPTRKIRATKSDLIRWTGVSDVTIDKHLKHLKTVGLLKVDFIIGSHEGNWYEVFTPEELPDAQLYQPNQPNQPNQSNPDLPNLPNLVGGVGGVKPVENTGGYENSKTYIKTNTNDDDAFAEFIKKFQTITAEITGKKLQKKDSENLEKLAELLILELKIAASQTDGISSVPAFLTEVLRRRLFSNKQSKETSPDKYSKIAPDLVGKSGSGNYEIKPLDKTGREAALEQLREFAAEDFLPDFKMWYTAEDWNWLINNLSMEKIKD